MFTFQKKSQPEHLFLNWKDKQNALGGYLMVVQVFIDSFVKCTFHTLIPGGCAIRKFRKLMINFIY